MRCIVPPAARTPTRQDNRKRREKQAGENTSRLAKKRRNRAQEDLIKKIICDRMVETSERHGGIRP